MSKEKIIVGIIFIVAGILFSLNNKNISEGAFKFYQAFYTKKNLKIMFRILGILLIVGGLILIFIN